MTPAALTAATRTAEISVIQLYTAAIGAVTAVIVAIIQQGRRNRDRNTSEHKANLGAVENLTVTVREGLAEMRTGQAGIRRDLTGLAERVDANQALAVAQREEMLTRLNRRRATDPPQTTEETP